MTPAQEDAKRRLKQQLVERHQQYILDKHPFTIAIKPRYGPTVHYDPKGPGLDGATVLSAILFTVIGVIALPLAWAFSAVLFALTVYIAVNESREAKKRWSGFSQVRARYLADRQQLVDQLGTDDLPELGPDIPPVMTRSEAGLRVGLCAAIVALVFGVFYLATHWPPWK